jgi:hypothetical protein
MLPTSAQPRQHEPQPDRPGSRRWWRAVPGSARSTNIPRAARGLVQPPQDPQALKVFSSDDVPCFPPVSVSPELLAGFASSSINASMFLTNSQPYASQEVGRVNCSMIESCRHLLKCPHISCRGSHVSKRSRSNLVDGERWLVFDNTHQSISGWRHLRNAGPFSFSFPVSRKSQALDSARAH